MQNYITKKAGNQDVKVDFEKIANELKDKFYPKKMSNLKLADWALKLDLMSENRVYGKINNFGYTSGGIVDCGKVLSFASDKEKVEKYLYNAKFCRWRFCPTCSWRLSLKRAFIVSVIMQKLIKQGYRFVMITLTIPNVPKDKLADTITELGLGWQRMVKRKKYKDFIVGGIRKVEVTYNYKRKDYHPHLHIICCMKPEYFKCIKTGSNGNRKLIYPNMVDFKIWQKDWQSAIRNSMASQIFVKAVSQNPQRLQKAILEISKYVAKDSDMEKSPQVFEGFFKGLKGKRLFSPFGLMSDLHNEFLKNPEEFKDCFDPRKPIKWFWKIVSNWDFEQKEYKSFFVELTDAEKIEIQRKWLGSLQEEDLTDKE